MVWCSRSLAVISLSVSGVISKEFSVLSYSHFKGQCISIIDWSVLSYLHIYHRINVITFIDLTTVLFLVLSKTISYSTHTDLFSSVPVILWLMPISTYTIPLKPHTHCRLSVNNRLTVSVSTSSSGPSKVRTTLICTSTTLSSAVTVTLSR